MNTKKIHNYIKEITSNVTICDSKLNTVQHIIPAALLKKFSVQDLEFTHKQKNFYTLPERYARFNRDRADKFLTHVESICFEALNNFIREAPDFYADNPSALLNEELFVNSSRKNVIAKFIAKFYVYLASLILRAPETPENSPITEKHFLKALDSHGLDLEQIEPPYDDALFRVARLSPYCTKKLAKHLMTLTGTVVINNENPFELSESLATRTNTTDYFLDAEYDVILSPSLKIEFRRKQQQETTPNP